MTLPSMATEDAIDGSTADNTLRTVLVEYNALMTNSATSSRWILPIAVVSSVNIAFPVIVSDTSPPGRMMQKFLFSSVPDVVLESINMFSAFSFAFKTFFNTFNTLGGVAALLLPLSHI